MYNILRLGPEFHQIALRNADYVFKFSEILPHPLDPLVPHLNDSLEFFLYFLTPAGLLFSVWGIFDGHRTHLRQRLVLSLWFVAPVLVQSAFAKAFTARYLLFSVPFAVILAAHAVEHIGQKSQKRVLFFAASSLILIPSFLFNYFLIRDPASVPLPRIERSGYLEGWTAGHGLREISAAISQSSKAGPVVVGSEGFFGTPFSALELYLNSDKNVRIVGVGTDIGSVPDKLLSARVDNQVFLVVNSSRFNIADPDKSGLKLLSSYPKAVKPDGTREYTLFFQLSK